MSIADHLPVLPVVVPLVAAPACVLLPRGTPAWGFAAATSWVTFVLAVVLLMTVSEAGTLTYALGGWQAPLGIVYRVDLAGAIVMALVSGMAALVLPYARQSVLAEVGEAQTSAFYGAFLVCLTGLMGVVATGDAFNVFVFLEISSLSTYALVAMGARQDRRALTAAFTYLVLGTIGATFFVIGLGLLYQVTGTLNMLDIHDRLAGQDDKVVRAAFAFVVTGLGLKLAMFPLHRWLPDAYTFAPSAVTAFLASTATKVAVYAMLRFLFTVFGFGQVFSNVAFGLFMVLGLAGMFAASLIAVFRDDVKQMLAFSSVAQVGYMLLGISFATADGVAAALTHVVNHAFMKAALFMAVGCVFYATGSHRLSAYKGIGKRLPFTAGCFVVAGLSLVGVPLTAGFVSKFVLVEAALDATLAVPSLAIVFLIVASSLLAVAYVGRVAYAMFLEDAGEDAATASVPFGMLVPMALVTAANVYVGLDGADLVALCRRAGDALMTAGFGGIAL